MLRRSGARIAQKSWGSRSRPRQELTSEAEFVDIMVVNLGCAFSPVSFKAVLAARRCENSSQHWLRLSVANGRPRFSALTVAVRFCRPPAWEHAEGVRYVGKKMAVIRVSVFLC